MLVCYLLRDLLTINSEDGVLVKDVARTKRYVVRANKKLDDTLRLFQKWKTHLCIVKDSKNVVVGIVTLEDVLEEIFGEIIDEHDKFVDMRELQERAH